MFKVLGRHVPPPPGVQPPSRWGVEANLRELLAFSPIWATGRWFDETNHVYVIVGVSENEAEIYDPYYEAGPYEAFESHTRPLSWVLNGNGGKCKGLAHTFQWYPLQFIKP